jgi:hypothetical protein
LFDENNAPLILDDEQGGIASEESDPIAPISFLRKIAGCEENLLPVIVV